MALSLPTWHIQFHRSAKLQLLRAGPLISKLVRDFVCRMLSDRWRMRMWPMNCLAIVMLNVY